jgi:hypothetical protein
MVAEEGETDTAKPCKQVVAMVPRTRARNREDQFDIAGPRGIKKIEEFDLCFDGNLR